MELVRLGDTSAEAYEKLVSLFKSDMVEMAPFENARDGLRLEDRVVEVGRNRRDKPTIESEENNLDGYETGNNLVGLSAPTKRMKAGKPSSSRDKAPHEGTGKISRFRSICKKPGHNRSTCPDRDDMPKQPRKEGRCSRCGVAEHRKSTCMKPLGFTDNGVE
uniref:Uncharacterized protein n=1 Tax=Avena sativa TaxID=4498 RepID=A0ACD5WYC2_AVESA